MTELAAPINTAAQLRQAQALQTQRQTGTSDLGQDDFLRLMTTQLNNQDPFQPMENGEFLAQMAQFSTVSGLDRVNETLGAISGQISASRIATGSSFLGQQVLVPGAVARPDADGAITGVVDLPQSAQSVLVRYFDPQSGAELHRQELGAQPAGLMGFGWHELPADLAAARTPVRISITAQSEGQSTDLGASVYARVTGVELGQEAGSLALRVEDYGLRDSREITALR